MQYTSKLRDNAFKLTCDGEFSFSFKSDHVSNPNTPRNPVRLHETLRRNDLVPRRISEGFTFALVYSFLCRSGRQVLLE